LKKKEKNKENLTLDRAKETKIWTAYMKLTTTTVRPDFTQLILSNCDSLQTNNNYNKRK